MEKNTKENLRMIKGMEKEPILSQMELKEEAFGRMERENQMVGLTKNLLKVKRE